MTRSADNSNGLIDFLLYFLKYMLKRFENIEIEKIKFHNY